MKKALLFFMLCTALAVSGCATKGVSRVETTEVIDLSGKWNDTDSRLVSEEMIKDALESPWLKKFTDSHGGKQPVVIVGTVRNESHEHINVETFTKDMERTLIKSGQVDFVASKSERMELRDERKEQAVQASEETKKAHGEETGADFMLKGGINTILDKIEGKAVMFYQVNLELIDVQSNKKVWIGEKKLKKFIERKRLGL